MHMRVHNQLASFWLLSSSVLAIIWSTRGMFFPSAGCSVFPWLKINKWNYLNIVLTSQLTYFNDWVLYTFFTYAIILSFLIFQKFHTIARKHGTERTLRVFHLNYLVHRRSRTLTSCWCFKGLLSMHHSCLWISGSLCHSLNPSLELFFLKTLELLKSFEYGLLPSDTHAKPWLPFGAVLLAGAKCMGNA